MPSKVLNMAKSLPRKVKVGFSFALGRQPFEQLTTACKFYKNMQFRIWTQYLALCVKKVYLDNRILQFEEEKKNIPDPDPYLEPLLTGDGLICLGGVGGGRG